MRKIEPQRVAEHDPDAEQGEHRGHLGETGVSGHGPADEVVQHEPAADERQQDGDRPGKHQP